ncbi:hypothetical protein GF402_02765 [Candidatus Fermentibacteria bacterium]|nr:hypothetical protein [Candidatus Fermentibacteria bacterium]
MSKRNRTASTEREGRMSRRTFFKALAGILLSAGSVALLSRSTEGSDRREAESLSRRRAMHYRNLAG